MCLCVVSSAFAVKDDRIRLSHAETTPQLRISFECHWPLLSFENEADSWYPAGASIMLSEMVAQGGKEAKINTM